MSPIGKTFIVLNLILAGFFVGFSGTYLQKQFNWKTKFEERDKAATEESRKLNSDIERMRQETQVLSTSKSRLDVELTRLTNERDSLKEENARLEQQNAQIAADLKHQASVMDGIKTSSDAAFKQASDAFQASVAAVNEKNEAVNAKNAAQAENRDLKNQIASLNETVSGKDVMIASLNKAGSEKDLLISVAKQHGFLEVMAVPPLAGTVSMVTGNLCTVQVTSNPTNIEPTPGTRLAIYDDQSGYKAEATVTRFNADTGSVFCSLWIKKGEVKAGDRASTHLAGVSQ